MVSNLSVLLNEFWEWAGISSSEYAQNTDAAKCIDTFYYPRFDELRRHCYYMINSAMSKSEIDDFLTCMALDSEEEIILDWCKEKADESFINKLAVVGHQHTQPEARWQIAELLQFKPTPMRIDFLKSLSADVDPYVKKRAYNALLCLAKDHLQSS